MSIDSEYLAHNPITPSLLKKLQRSLEPKLRRLAIVPEGARVKLADHAVNVVRVPADATELSLAVPQTDRGNREFRVLVDAGALEQPCALTWDTGDASCAAVAGAEPVDTVNGGTILYSFLEAPPGLLLYSCEAVGDPVCGSDVSL